jgi:SAM-dependent methyltransferase
VEDLTGPISYGRSRDPLYTIFPFLRRALLPEPSCKQDPDRFDNLVADFLVSLSEPTCVLDLGCGDWLLLEKLLERHDSPDQHFRGQCSYLGIDMGEGDIDRWNALESKACPVCFRVNKLHFDLRQDAGLVGALEANGPFDRIILANVLHELTPQRGWELFRLMFHHLAPEGQLLVIDPDYDWCFSSKAWTPAAGEWHLQALPVEWEADAVWLSRANASAVLNSMGFVVDVHPQHRPTMDLWAAVASRPAAPASLRSDEGKSALRDQLASQVDDQREKIARLRRELRARFRHQTVMTGELLVMTFRFFAACASQCRRMEALKELES